MSQAIRFMQIVFVIQTVKNSYKVLNDIVGQVAFLLLLAERNY